MCRARSDGGRRCQGCQRPTAAAAHNARRRANRAIRRNLVEWARQRGYVPAELEQLAAAPPNVAKKWAEAKGMNPNDFVNGIPDDPAINKAGAVAAPDGVAAPAAPPGGPAAPVGRGRPSRRAGVGAGGAAAAHGGSPGAQRPEANAPDWTQASWCTEELRDQIQAVMRLQGSHRDERSLLNGGPERVTTLGDERVNTSPTAGSNTTRRIELDNGAVGYFKPFGGENKALERGFGQDSALQSLHEAAAWRLASQIGPPWSEIVPPVVIREIRGEIGSFQLERAGKVMATSPWDTGEWREAAFFDCLIGQQDRHPQNYLVAGDRLSLIDHGYTFARPGDYRNWSWFSTRRVQTEPVLTHREREVLQRLVSSPDLMGMQDMLQPARARALRERAEKMLAAGAIREDY